MKYILVLSGGGAKGILQMEILKQLEIKGILKNISLILGTSAGAINGSILSTKILTAQELCNVYPDMLKEIFKKRFLRIPIYDRKNFINSWNKYIPTKMKIGDVKIPLVITSTEYTDKENVYFKSYKDHNEDLLDCVLKSFAAPYYFGLIYDDIKKKIYGDGGMGDQNYPITEASLESLNLNIDWATEEVKFIIVGSGFSNIKQSYRRLKFMNLLGELLQFMRPGDGGFARLISRQRQINQMTFLCKKLKNIHFDYYDYELPKKMDSMDKLKYMDDYIKFGLEASKKPLISM